jgi:hypothetical protein
MTIQFQQMVSLTQCDFDNLFLESINGFDKNYPNPMLQTYEDKQNFYKINLEAGILQNSPHKKDGETFLMFKVILDNKDVMLKAGYIEANGITYREHWFLTAADNNNSRNWMYTEEFDTAQREFLATFGVTQLSMLTYVGSDLYKMMKYRSLYVIKNNLTNRAYIAEEIADENPVIIPFHENLQFVILIVAL